MPSLYLVKNFVGIKLGTGGLVRAYGGAASDCLRTCLIKSKVLIFNVCTNGIEIPYDLLGVLYHQGLEDAVKSNCSHHVVFYKH
ncbi:unnamed protein product [Rhodiola kirilowii]